MMYMHSLPSAAGVTSTSAILKDKMVVRSAYFGQIVLPRLSFCGFLNSAV